MKAIIKRNNLEVFVREDLKPIHGWNNGMIVVSKQPTGVCTFCVNKEDLEISK